MQMRTTNFSATKEPSQNDNNLWKVADKMSALPINLRQNIEEKRLDVEVQSLVVEEQFG